MQHKLGKAAWKMVAGPGGVKEAHACSVACSPTQATR